MSVWLAANPAWFYGLLGVLGLLVGSFLNVVALRLPRILQERWQQECTEFLNAGVESSGDTGLDGE